MAATSLNFRSVRFVRSLLPTLAMTGRKQAPTVSQCCRRRWLTTNEAEEYNSTTWNEMNEKSRSLATLLLGYDDLWMDKKSAWKKTKKSNEKSAIISNYDNQQNNSSSRADHVFNRRRSLSQAITMIESRKPEHQRQSNLLLTYLLGQENNHVRKLRSFRLGIAGPPGAGKSTFVEAFGKYLLNLQSDDSGDGEGSMGNDNDSLESCHKLAVICIDPSSVVTGGSILGDKTRMTEISRHERVCHLNF